MGGWFADPSEVPVVVHECPRVTRVVIPEQLYSTSVYDEEEKDPHDGDTARRKGFERLLAENGTRGPSVEERVEAEWRRQVPSRLIVDMQRLWQLMWKASCKTLDIRRGPTMSEQTDEDR
jgi:hypothetical protein